MRFLGRWELFPKKIPPKKLHKNVPFNERHLRESRAVAMETLSAPDHGVTCKAGEYELVWLRKQTKQTKLMAHFRIVVSSLISTGLSQGVSHRIVKNHFF